MMSMAPVDTESAREALEARGGFLWWYLDAVDENGNGVVVIWSFGLPFLPDYLAAARNGSAPPARERPSLNVAVYRDGELDCYLLQEFETGQVAWSLGDREWRFGRSEMATSEGRASVRLDCAIPGTADRLEGTIDIEGPRPDPPTDADEAAHRWHPRIIRGAADIDLRVGKLERYRSKGRAYHDVNCGTVPFDHLDIERWIWGRLPLSDRELVYFGLWPHDDGEPEHMVLEFGEDGTWSVTDDVAIEVASPRINLGAMRWWRRFQIVGPPEAPWSPITVDNDDVVDSGPFYMRYVTRADTGGETSTGVAELIRPSRVDLDRHRPFVRMRHQEVGGRNSTWLPLFSGPRRGRLRRLLAYNFGKAQ